MGDPRYSDEYLDHLCDQSGFDGVTFQVREPAFYAKGATEKSLMLSDEYYAQAASRVREAGLKFGVALSDLSKLEAFESMQADLYKVLSKDIGDLELLRALLATGKPVWVSTGKSDEDEIERVLGVVGKAGNLALIHTQLTYDDAETNLRAIARLREHFGVPVGFGLHATDSCALVASVAFEPASLFLYVKGHGYAKHRDERHALSLGEATSIVPRIRRAEAMLGSGVKKKMENQIPDQRG